MKQIFAAILVSMAVLAGNFVYVSLTVDDIHKESEELEKEVNEYNQKA